jgi:hypothetical protein
MFESRHQRHASRTTFAKRMVVCLFISLFIVAGALGVGVLGYHQLAHFSWIDSLLNASMILGGMGPVTELPCDEAKLFASIYALFSGLVLVMLTGLMLAPVAHRILHRFHVDERDMDEAGKSSAATRPPHRH